MRICVYGAGAMGTSFGALLSEAVGNCVLVSRNQPHIAALKRRGAILRTDKTELTIPVQALLPEEMTGKYDLIVLATKQRENAVIARYLKPYLKEDGAIVTVQNGLPEASLAEIFGADAVYGATLTWGAETVEAGAVRLTSASGFRIALGAYGAGTRLQEIDRIFSRAFTVTTGNLKEIRYAKLSINASFSTLSAITGLPFGTIAKKYKKYALALMREVFVLARTEGCKKLPLNGYDILKTFGGFGASVLLPIAMKKYRNTRSGMLKDLASGKRCEVDYVAGAVLRAGERCGIALPLMSRAVALVHDIENGFAEIAPESLELLTVL